MWVAQLVPLQGEELGRGRGGLGAGKVGEETAVSVVGWWRGEGGGERPPMQILGARNMTKGMLEW